MGCIGVVVFEVGVLPEYENVRSAHIQLPLKLYSLLRKKYRGRVKLVTNNIAEGKKLPVEMEGDQPVFISDPRSRSSDPVMISGRNTGVNPFRIVLSLFQLLRAVKTNNISIVHLFGGRGVGLYAAGLKCLMPSLRVIWTTYHNSSTVNWLEKVFTGRIDHGIAYTDFVADVFRRRGLPTTVIKHTVLRKLKMEDSPKFRVTFWRDPSYQNGADIAASIFQELAHEYPDVVFTFMVRPHWDDIDLNFEAENIEVYRYPYPIGVSLEQVLSETLVCFFPFRHLSTNPQLCILESLLAGLPCVVSNIESVAEYSFEQLSLFEINDKENAKELLRNCIENKDNFQLGSVPHEIPTWDEFLSLHENVYFSKNEMS